MIREPEARYKRIKSRRARTLHGTKSTGLIVSGHVAFQAGRIIHMCLVTSGTLLLRNITYTSQPRSSMKLPYYHCLSFYITLLFITWFCFLSFFHSRSLSFFVRLDFANRHVIFQFGSLWLYMYVSWRNLARFIVLFLALHISKAIPLSKITRRLVERHRYFTLNCCHCHCDCRFRAKFI